MCNDELGFVENQRPYGQNAFDNTKNVRCGGLAPSGTQHLCYLHKAFCWTHIEPKARISTKPMRTKPLNMIPFLTLLIGDWNDYASRY